MLGINWELKFSQYLRRNSGDREPRVSKASPPIELKAEPSPDRMERPSEREWNENPPATTEKAKERDNSLLKRDLQLLDEPSTETTSVQLVTNAREGD